MPACLVMGLVSSSAVYAEGLEITPPSAPAAAPAATEPVAPIATPAPATQPQAATAPATPDRLLENLLHHTPAAPETPTVSGPAVPSAPAPGIEAAPNAPVVSRIRDGQYITRRTGRLVKDEKTGQWLFVFDADGKDMKDPPMVILPNLYLQSMEQMTEKGTKPIRFNISGEVTEYQGKNFLLIHFVKTERDYNQGLN